MTAHLRFVIKLFEILSGSLSRTYSHLKDKANFQSIENSGAPSIVCVSHDAIFHGAQLLLLHINQVLKERFGFRVTTILLAGGPLREQFSSAGKVVDFTNPPWHMPASSEVMRARQLEIKRLYLEGARYAICNTTVSGSILHMFKNEGFQVISLIHELPNLIREFQLEPAVKEIGRWADRVVFPAEFVRDRFLPISELNASRAVIRPQGLYRSNPYRNDKADARTNLIAALHIGSNARIVVAAGPCDRRKGVDIFCQVAELVVRSSPEVHFVWIGEDGTDMGSSFKAWVESVGLNRNVHFTGVVKDPDLYLRYIAAADIYLITSREDPYPSVVLDAMDVGVPVVGFENAGGFAELLEEGAGILVPYEDRDAMAAALNTLLVDSDRATRMGVTGQHIIDTRFDFQDYVHDLLRYVGYPISLSRDNDA
ncbi:MAG: glycosyltransferase family 4 protein [Pseudomonadota bacterium]|nr:glycosyltransferase family 4 protein [Pseudomonadota bacterium]